MRSNKAEKISVEIVFMSILIFLLIINSVTPLMGEDIALAAFPKDYHTAGAGERFYLMFHRIYEQMTNWNIRIGEQLSIVFGCFDKVLFNICNSLVSLFYIWLAYQYAFKRKFSLDKRNVLYLLAVFTLILMLQPVLGEIFFWRTGSTNYLWAICILLGFALPIRYYIGYKSFDIIGNSKSKIALLTIFGFVAGFTNENTVIVIILLYVGVILSNRKKKVKTPIWIYSSGITLLTGFIGMCKAPSTANRVAIYKEMYGIDTVTFGDYMIRARAVIVRFFTDNIAFVIVTVIMLVLYTSMIVLEKGAEKSQKLDTLKKNSEALGLLLLSAVSCGALIMSPYIETRSFLLPDFFMTTCIIYYFDKILDKYKKYERILSSIACISLIICCICQGTAIYHAYREYYDYAKLREAAVELENKNDVFVWGEYRKPLSSRILTTREDYLLGNENVLNTYYGKEIKCWGNYLWNMDISDYEVRDVLGSIDTITYDETSDTVNITGWAAFKQEYANESECYVYIDTEENRYYFRTAKSERGDVALALDNEELYLNSGFSTGIGWLHNWLENKPEVTVGLSVVNEEKGYAYDGVAEQKVRFE